MHIIYIYVSYLDIRTPQAAACIHRSTGWVRLGSPGPAPFVPFWSWANWSLISSKGSFVPALLCTCCPTWSWQIIPHPFLPQTQPRNHPRLSNLFRWFPFLSMTIYSSTGLSHGHNVPLVGAEGQHGAPPWIPQPLLLSTWHWSPWAGSFLPYLKY